MHTRQLKPSMYQVQIDGRSAGIDALLPAWHGHDRFGIVVREPFGAIGASLLIQCAIVAFYEQRQQYAGELAEYPEIYLFHDGRRFGDHSAFDFWPPRKEVSIEDDPRAVLGAINDRAITRLAVPNLSPVPQSSIGRNLAARSREFPVCSPIPVPAA